MNAAVMGSEHIGVVSGLSDLANFMAALKKRGFDDDSTVRIVLFGHDVSLPINLQREFNQVVGDAYPHVDLLQVAPSRLQGNKFDTKELSLPEPLNNGESRILYGNSVHKPVHQTFYKFLKADEFIFFDNGLSSYWEHKADIAKSFAKSGIPHPRMVCLSLSPPLSVPTYLFSFEQRNLQAEDFADTYGRMKKAAPDAAKRGSLPKHIILGTSLFRTRHMSWQEERDVYLRLIESLIQQSTGEILFKAHPRAADHPLIFADDGVIVMDSTIPIEAFAESGLGNFAYSISSTSLFTLQKYFGYTAFRLDSAPIRRLLEKVPHLRLSSRLPRATFDRVKKIK